MSDPSNPLSEQVLGYEQYPEFGTTIRNLSTDPKAPFSDLLKIYFVESKVAFYFLPYNLKIVESSELDAEKAILPGAIDVIPLTKASTRNVTVSFQARQKLDDTRTPTFFSGDELLHSIDHIKRCIYPLFNSNGDMAGIQLAKIQYKNLLVHGESTSIISPTNGMAGYILSFKADPVFEPNSIYYERHDNILGRSAQNDSIGSGNYAYPKIFDISFTFGVKNTNTELKKPPGSGILTKRFFYMYRHGHTHKKDPTVSSTAPSDDIPDTSTINNNANLNSGGESNADNVENIKIEFTPSNK